MNEEEKFDELLSSKLAERDFPFDELNWDEAERLIIQQEGRRKTLRFALIFSSGLVAGLLIMLPFLINSHSPLQDNVATPPAAQQTQVAKTNVSSPTNQSVSNTNNPIHKEEKVALPPSESTRTGVQSAFVKKDTRTKIQGNSSVHSPVAAKAAEQHSSPSLAAANKTASSLSSAKSSHADNAVNSPAPPSATKPINSMVADNLSSSPPASKIAVNDSPPSSSANNTVTESSMAPSNVTDKTEKNNTHDNTDNHSSNTNTKSITPENSSSIIARNNVPPPLPKNNKSSAAIKDSSNEAADPVFETGNLYPNILSVYAGGNYSLGWKTPALAGSTKEGYGITPWAGFSFMHYFGGSLSASIGVGYAEVINLKGSYSNSSLQYDFGSTANGTTVSPEMAYYIAFPLKLQYNIDDRNQIGIGCDYMLMLTTYSLLTTYAQTDFSPNTQTSEKQNGFTQGFSNSDWQVMVSYTRMLTARLGISAEYYRDLNYIENNTMPNINQSAKNNGFRLIVSYQILK